MTEEEKEAMNENEIKFRAYLLILNSEFPTHRKTEAMEELLKIYNKQQKEIEEEHKNWKELLHEYGIKCQELEVLREENFDTVYIQAIADYKSKIREILQIEGNADIETYLKTIVAENNRLEDIEDDRDCNYVSKDKIRSLLKQVNTSLYHFKDSEKNNIMQRIKDRLEQLLEE